MNSKLMGVLVLLGGGLAIAAYFQQKHTAEEAEAAAAPKRKFTPLIPLSPGAVFTGNFQSTGNNRPPNFVDEVVGYGTSDWAETVSPNGRKDWVPIKQG